MNVQSIPKTFGQIGCGILSSTMKGRGDLHGRDGLTPTRRLLLDLTYYVDARYRSVFMLKSVFFVHVVIDQTKEWSMWELLAYTQIDDGLNFVWCTVSIDFGRADDKTFTLTDRSESLRNECRRSTTSSSSMLDLVTLIRSLLMYILAGESLTLLSVVW